jgi:hypothetical protein
MAHKTFEHAFDSKGSVTFRSVDGARLGKRSDPRKFETAEVSSDVCAISYMSSGFTLTVVLNFESGKLFAFSSNEKEMTLQRGTFEDVTDGKSAPRTPEPKSASPSAARS